MSERRIVIIEAGIAGPAAGRYARTNGYRTHIVEMHDKPSGLRTVWTRQGYTIDGCIHWLTGPLPVTLSTRSGRSSARCRGAACSITTSL
jgi:phytoene dehydrogenase-like protein